MWTYFLRFGHAMMVIFLVLLDWWAPYVLQPTEERLTNFQGQLLRPDHASSRIVLVGIDDETFKKNYFNRKVHAKVIDKLTQIKVACYFYDVEFDEARGPEMDQALCEAVARSSNGVLAGALHYDNANHVDLRQQQFLIPGLAQLVATNQVLMGLINVSSKQGGIEYLLAAQPPDSAVMMPSAALAMFCVSKHVLPSQVRQENGVLHVGDVRVPVRPTQQDLGQETPWQFYKIPVHFQTPVTGPSAKNIAPDDKRGFRVISYNKLVEEDAQHLNWLANKIVIVGENSSRDVDTVETPVGTLKGFEVHANILNTLLDGHWPRRVSQLENGAFKGWILNGLLILALCALLHWHLSQKRVGWKILLLFGSHLLIYGVIHLVFLESGYILKLSLAVICYFATFIVQVANRFEASRRLLRTFVPEVVANQLLSVGHTIEGEIEATVIVTDIRGYTTLSETKTPKQILLMLNEYHTETVAIFERFHGNVLNYQGDAQIVIFGYPRKLKDAPERAIKAGLATAEAVERLRQRWGITDRNQFDVGCGICTGPVAVGELGAAGIQAEYTVIGETVRLCHKVQGMSTALEGNVLMDEATYKACSTKPPVHRFDDITLEGIVYPVSIYRAEAAAQTPKK